MMTAFVSHLSGHLDFRITRASHQRRFSEADKHRILEEVAQGGTSVADVARRYGIDRRVLRRWKQELAAAPAPTFVTVHITDTGAPSCAGPAAEGAVCHRG
jgi:hypothetical protein